MSPEAWAAVIAALGIVLSIAGAAIIVSYRVGKIEAELRASASSLQAQTVAAIGNMTERLAKIEGMFELRLKGGTGAGD